MIYHFDRYVYGRLRAQGALIENECSEEAARKRAHNLFDNEEGTTFVLREQQPEETP